MAKGKPLWKCVPVKKLEQLTLSLYIEGDSHNSIIISGHLYIYKLGIVVDDDIISQAPEKIHCMI